MRSAPAGGAPDRLRPHSIDELRLLDSERLRHAFSICRIRTPAVFDVPPLDVLSRVAHRPPRVPEHPLLLSRCHLPEQVAGLLPVVVLEPVVPVRRIAFD